MKFNYYLLVFVLAQMLSPIQSQAQMTPHTYPEIAYLAALPNELIIDLFDRPINATKGDHGDCVIVTYAQHDEACRYRIFKRKKGEKDWNFFIEKSPSDNPIIIDKKVDVDTKYEYKITTMGDESRILGIAEDWGYRSIRGVYPKAVPVINRVDCFMKRRDSTYTYPSASLEQYKGAGDREEDVIWLADASASITETVNNCDGSINLSIEICNAGKARFDVNASLAIYQRFIASGQYQLLEVSSVPEAVGVDSCIYIEDYIISDLGSGLSEILAIVNDCGSYPLPFLEAALNSDLYYELSAIQECNFSNNLARDTIEVSKNKRSQIAATICEGETYQFGDSLFAEAGSYEIQLESAAGCDSLVQLELEQVEQKVVLLGDIAICRGEATQLTVADNFTTYEWAADSSLSCLDCPDPIARPEKSTTYYLSVPGCNDQILKSELAVTIKEPPYLAIDRARSAYANHPISLNLDYHPSEVEGVFWFDEIGELICENCPNLIVQPSKSTTYTVKLIGKNQCVVTDSVAVEVLPVREICEPVEWGGGNIITPNGDGINDVFIIEEIEGIELQSIKIFDVKGAEIFRSDDITKAWDGTYEGKPLPEGTYFYIVQYSCLDENVYTKSGFTVIKY